MYSETQQYIYYIILKAIFLALKTNISPSKKKNTQNLEVCEMA